MADLPSFQRLWCMLSVVILGYVYSNQCLASTVSIMENSGYKNVVVAIGERVPEDINLIEKIKDDFTEASAFLFEATQRRFYFSEITILVPRSWNNFNPSDLIHSERFETSDVIIDISQDPRPNRPFTNKNSGCGQPGRYINLTPTFIMDSAEADKYGGYGRTISHEWAHYRWGIFDEYPRPGSAQFYAAYNGHYQATRCTTAIRGRVKYKDDNKVVQEFDSRINGEPPENSYFEDDDVMGSYTASLLYKQYMSKVSDFCDWESNDNNVDSAIRHNREAPNQQNIHCFGKSTRQVIKEHSDYKSQPNRLTDTTDTTPTFKTVRPTINYWVLVLDTSGSMKGERLRQLRQAASNFISTAVQIGEYLSIVSFNGTVQLNAPLTMIQNDQSRKNLINDLPTQAGGTSNLGEGIQSGRAQLYNRNIFDGRMLVITDGEETQAPFIKDIIHLLTEISTVDTIAIGPATTPNLESLARETGGQSFYHSDSSTTLDEAFKEFSERNRGASDALITVFTKYLILTPGSQDYSQIFIDSSIGTDTQFLFDYSQGEASVDGVLTRPDGSQITKSNTLEYYEDSSFSLTRINIAGNARAGVWDLMLTNTSPQNQNVTIIVQSRARVVNGNTVDPISASATWGKENVDIMADTVETNNQTVFVTVSKGYIPILYANVNAAVTVPDQGQLLSFPVKDDGLGADIQRSDGIYSAFLTQFRGEQRYGLSIMVDNANNEAIISPETVLGQGSVIDPADAGMPLDDRKTEAFQRVVNGGSFTCSGPLCSGNTDVFPPARILDLKASVLDLTEAEVTLTFTSPGDDLMAGRVWTFELRQSIGDINILYDDFLNADIVSTFVPVVPAREMETFSVSNLQVGAHSYFFAIVAIDDMGHRSLVSNIASASMRFVTIPGGPTWTEPPTTTPRPPDSTTESGSGEQDSTSPIATTEPPATAIDPVLIAVVVAVPILLLLIAAVIIALCLLCKKRRNTPPKPVDKEGILPHNGHHNGMPVYGNVNRTVSPDSYVDDTRNAQLVYRSEPSVDDTRDAEVVFRPGMSMDNTRDAELLFRPGTSMDNTRDAQLVSKPNGKKRPVPLPPEPNPLETKAEVKENFYSGLPEKRTDFPNGGAGSSGLTRNRDGTYMDMSQGGRRPAVLDSDSDSEDEISREKRRIHEMQMQEPEYY